MFTVKNLQETAAGNLECELLNGETWSEFVMSPSDEYEIHEDSDWSDIKPCDQFEKDKHEQEQARATFKVERAQAVDALTIETALGVFDADERSQDRMARAVVAMGGTDTIEWVLNNNTVVTVTAEQLKEALQLAGAAQSALWTQ